MFFSFLISLSIDVTSTSSSAFVEQPDSGQDVTSRCELHVWPAERLDGQAFYVAFAGGLTIRGRSSDQKIENAMEDLLSSSSQLNALRGVNLVNELRLAENTKIVEHQEALNRKTVNKIKLRRSQSSSPCYSELIMMEHRLYEDIVWGDRFQTAFLFRDFGSGSAPMRSFRTTSGNKLKILTLPEGARPPDAAQQVAAALRANFLEYARNARAGMKAQ